MTDNARIVREHALGQGLHPIYEARIEVALTALETELATAKAREAGLTKALAEVQADLEQARKAIIWALGAGDDFPPKVEGRPFWWRTELQKRAGLEWNGKKFVPTRAALAPEQKP